MSFLDCWKEEFENCEKNMCIKQWELRIEKRNAI